MKFLKSGPARIKLTIRSIAIIAGVAATFDAVIAPAGAAKAGRTASVVQDHRTTGISSSGRINRHPCHYGCATVRDHRPTDWKAKNSDAVVRDHRDPWVPKPRLPR
jgi:hypothetical protein